MFPWEQVGHVGGLWATKSEGVGLIVRAISFQDFQPVILIHRRHRRTDRRTTCDRKTALYTTMHHAVKQRLFQKSEFCKTGRIYCILYGMIKSKLHASINILA